MNKIQLIGRLTKDPEFKVTPNGKENCTFTLAVERNYKNADGKREADFIPCVAWGKPAEIIANFISKGDRFGVTGRIQVRNYTANDGQKRYVTEVIVEEFDFLESKKGGNSLGREVQEKTPFDEDIPF